MDGLTVTADGIPIFNVNASYIWGAAQYFPSGDLKILNPAGTFSYSIVGSAILANRNLTLPLINGNATLTVAGATTVILKPGNPSTTASLSYVMMGLANGTNPTVFTPSKYGIIMVYIDGQVANGSANDGVSFYIAYGTGTAPVNGAAATGTQTGNTLNLGTFSYQYGQVFCVTRLITGLTPGTQIWIDIAAESLVGGTTSFTQLTATIEELPY